MTPRELAVALERAMDSTKGTLTRNEKEAFFEAVGEYVREAVTAEVAKQVEVIRAAGRSQ